MAMVYMEMVESIHKYKLSTVVVIREPVNWIITFGSSFYIVGPFFPFAFW